MEAHPDVPAVPALPSAVLPALPKHLGVRGSEAGADDSRPCVDDLKQACREHIEGVLDWIVARGEQPAPPHMSRLEDTLHAQLQTLGLLLLSLFLAVIERRVERYFPSRLVIGGRRYKRRPAQARNVMTRFGVLRHSRRYYRSMSFDHTRGISRAWPRR